MLQNRVDPAGNIIITNARGAWMGNRGQLHDEQKNILRPYKLKAWLTCLLDFNGRKRQVMAINRYTELFFMDEATAFSAGHRPCFECRRKDYERFKSSWIKGNRGDDINVWISAGQIDDILHSERIDRKGQKVTYEDYTGNLPNGAFILLNNKPFLVANDHIYQWSVSGYDKGIKFDGSQKAIVLTPRSMINAFKAGYEPQMAMRSEI